MASGVATVHVRRSHGKMVIQGDGQTPKGKRFIRQTTKLKAGSMADPDFKTQMALAVEGILAQGSLPL